MMFDLNGLIDMDLFYKYYNYDGGNKAYSFLLNYIIGNVFYSSSLYTRQRVLGTSFDFTTSYEIYNLTGVYSIHFDEIDNKNLALFNDVFNEYGDLSCSLFDLKRIGNVVLSGSLKMLSLYENPISFLSRYSDCFPPKLNLISIGNEMLEGVDNQSFKDLLYMESHLNLDDITLNDFLAPYILCENKLEYLSCLPSIIPIITTERYTLLMELLTSNNYRLDVLYIHNMASMLVNNFSIYYYDLELLCKYVDNVYVLYDESCVNLDDESIKIFKYHIKDLPINILAVGDVKLKDSLMEYISV